ncbi:TPM domain-containing protein [Sphingobacterium humi]|uniref:TPM domain-containing protein n=1 Tax=Sphingobacterium humi TaxID=1796905 RepID=A0A6N8KXN6_9SPHI|nr:TPM domain-containing protein [Sphingobacterium humi]MVZ61847.1 TPM domain-containing protein [Sphingobacterium humi]
MEIFNQEEQEKIVQAISLAENQTSGEIRLVVERTSKGSDAYSEAKRYFEKLGMHKTTLRNGVLIYLATEDHQFAIIGDAGIHAKVGDDFWESTKEKMVSFFRNGDFMNGLIEGIHEAGTQLATFFPRRGDDVNELPNDIYFGKS